jgi:hypothetical protein
MHDPNIFFGGTKIGITKKHVRNMIKTCFSKLQEYQNL